MIESFCGRMQTELFNTKTWTTVEELSIPIADYIENFHKTRRHSALDMLTPTEFETLKHPSCAMREPGPKTGGRSAGPKTGGRPREFISAINWRFRGNHPISCKPPE